jgi:hypothetical protein
MPGNQKQDWFDTADELRKRYGECDLVLQLITPAAKEMNA